MRGLLNARGIEARTEYQKKIEGIGVRSIPELMRISSDTSVEISVRRAAIRRLYSEPRALPTLIELLNDSSPVIRSAAAGALDSCLKIGHALDGAILDSAPSYGTSHYRAWWTAHRLDYLDAWRVAPDSRAVPEGLGEVREIRETIEEMIRGGHFAKHDERVTRIKWTPGAVPELVRLSGDTSYPNRRWVLLLLGMMEDSSVEPYLLDVLQETRDEGLRRAAVQGLNQLLNLGAYNAGDPKEEEIVARYLRRR